MSLRVLYDANVLYPNSLRDLLIRVDAKRVWACLQRIADSRRRPPETIDDVLAQLERSGLIESTAALRAG